MDLEIVFLDWLKGPFYEFLDKDDESSFRTFISNNYQLSVMNINELNTYFIEKILDKININFMYKNKPIYYHMVKTLVKSKNTIEFLGNYEDLANKYLLKLYRKVDIYELFRLIFKHKNYKFKNIFLNRVGKIENSAKILSILMTFNRSVINKFENYLPEYKILEGKFYGDLINKKNNEVEEFADVKYLKFIMN